MQFQLRNFAVILPLTTRADELSDLDLDLAENREIEYLNAILARIRYRRVTPGRNLDESPAPLNQLSGVSHGDHKFGKAQLRSCQEEFNQCRHSIEADKGIARFIR